MFVWLLGALGPIYFMCFNMFVFNVVVLELPIISYCLLDCLLGPGSGRLGSGLGGN